jgi:hypothetical protein
VVANSFATSLGREAMFFHEKKFREMITDLEIYIISNDPIFVTVACSCAFNFSLCFEFKILEADTLLQLVTKTIWTGIENYLGFKGNYD